MNNINPSKSYLRLHKNAALKHLEEAYIYNTYNDELYEIDNKALEFLKKCDGQSTGEELTDDMDFVEYCIEEKLLEALPEARPIPVMVGKSPIPSLKYLELQLLNKCNLKCGHCYLGPAGQNEITLEKALKITEEFSGRGGLRLLISGGEPMLYSHLKEFIEKTGELKIRRALLTNGTLINEKNISWLNVENIQFSLDGWEEGHDLLRGKGAFKKTINGIRLAREAGISVSFATMIHKGNLHEFEKMKEFVNNMGAAEWGVDVPCVAGSLKHNQDALVPYEESARFMEYATGGGYHGSSGGYACGRHLMTVLPTGIAVKCGFYKNDSLGDAGSGLINAWLNLKHIPLDDLECKDCEVIESCIGGCRFRAPSFLARDPAMCVFHGVS